MPAPPQQQQQQQMIPEDIIDLFGVTRPGIKRDGTDVDSIYYNDGQWVRWQRGRPRKIGGYRSISALLTGPIRHSFVDSRAGVNSLHTFSPWGVQRLEFNSDGSGGTITERTPSGFAKNDLLLWSADRMYSGAGSPYTAIIAASAPSRDDIATDTGGGLYYGNINATAALAAAADISGPISVSGGCVVLQPFLVVYGSNGMLRNTIANPDLSNTASWSGTNTNTANVAGTKIVAGLPLRGGSSSPAGVFWALDSLIRMSFVGGTKIWQFDTVSAKTTILSSRGVVEYDGVYFWVGIDRFYTYNGVVQELPNQMNVNWFFDNLNTAQRQKVWAMALPRWGEIWWFFPYGSATECTHAVIFNVREGAWYDCALSRLTGTTPQVFPYPVLCGGEDDTSTTYFTYTAGTGTFAIGQTVTGGTSGATGTVARALASTPPALNLTGISGTFQAGEAISSSGGATGTAISATQDQTLSVAWQHEYGTDKVFYQDSFAIRSYFETNNFGFPVGGPQAELPPTNFQTFLRHIEPDFVQSGNMIVYVNGKSYANSPVTVSDPYTFSPTTERVDMREQRRLVSIKFESNVLGGNYQAGKVLVTYGRGDARG